MFWPDSRSISSGPHFAPWVARAFALADLELDTGIETVEPAPDVRARLGDSDQVGDNAPNLTH